MAYSSGFNPHPRISYAGAAPTGSASEAEYLEIGLAERLDPDALRDTLDEALPDGLDIVGVAESPGGALAELLTSSRWRLDTDASAGDLEAAVVAFLGSESVLVERMTKKGLREFDARGAVASLVVDGSSLDLLLHHTVPAVRPDDVLSALRRVHPLETGPAPLLTRLDQGVLAEDGATLRPPFG